MAGDHNLYKMELIIPMRSVLHHFIGIAARCHEEKHLLTIAEQDDVIRRQAGIIVKYLKRYGPLRKEN